MSEPEDTITLTRTELKRVVLHELVRHIEWQKKRRLLRFGGYAPNFVRLGIPYSTTRYWLRQTPEGIIADPPLPEPEPAPAPMDLPVLIESPEPEQVPESRRWWSLWKR